MHPALSSRCSSGITAVTSAMMHLSFSSMCRSDIGGVDGVGAIGGNSAQERNS